MVYTVYPIVIIDYTRSLAVSCTLLAKTEGRVLRQQNFENLKWKLVLPSSPLDFLEQPQMTLGPHFMSGKTE